jgi:hypothetical protein
VFKKKLKSHSNRIKFTNQNHPEFTNQNHSKSTDQNHSKSTNQNHSKFTNQNRNGTNHQKPCYSNITTIKNHTSEKLTKLSKNHLPQQRNYRTHSNDWQAFVRNHDPRQDLAQPQIFMAFFMFYADLDRFLFAGIPPRIIPFVDAAP